jgi:hypothetical protein
MQETAEQRLRAQNGERDEDNVSGHEQNGCESLTATREIRIPSGNHERGDSPPKQGAGPV